MLNKKEPQRRGDFHFKNVCIVFVQEKASDGLEEVRLKPWAKPLSSALRVGAFAAKNLEGFVPGASTLEGALSFEPAFSIPRQPWKTFRRVWWRSKKVVRAHKRP